MKGRIIQDARLFLQKNGEAKMRHVKHWPDYEKICGELGISTDYSKRTFLEPKDMPPEGRPITEWPEKESQIGPERVMFCVGPDDDFTRIAALGITIIQSYELPYINTLHFLDRALDQNLKVYYSIASRVGNEILRTGSWDRNEVARIIEKCKDHPALFCWHVVEEANLAGRHISHEVQKEIYDFFKNRDSHPVTQTLAGGTSNWDEINFDAMDFITPDTYAYNGTGKMHGKDPLPYLAEVGRQEREYLDKNDITKPIMFLFQCCDEPAVHHDPPIENSKVPLGHIEDQFNVLKPYGLFTLGVGCGWAWNGGFFGPGTSDEMYEEVKSLLDKIKEG